jgi:ELWxxDGT repeat protein
MSGTLYFSANNGISGYELWKSNGTYEGTVLVKDIEPGNGNSRPRYLINVGGTLFFQANNAANGYELWKSDGTPSGTVLVNDILSGNGSSSPFYLTNVNGTVFFRAFDSAHSLELWKTNGTSSGTVLVKDIIPGTDTSQPSYLANVNGMLFFQARDSGTNRELWKSDGTSEGTVLVSDISPGTGGSSPQFLTNTNGTLFFRANDGIHGFELWKSDGTSSGTTLVKDIRPGSGYSDVRYLTNVEGTIFFRANDGTNGNELWQSDGTSSGTTLVRDINPGNSDSSPSFLFNSSGRLFFAATANSTVGSELWVSADEVSTPMLNPLNDSGISNNDNITKDRILHLLGNPVSTNSYVEILDGGLRIGTATASGTGDWSFFTPLLAEGSHSFTVSVTDSLGFYGSSPTPLQVTIDFTAPAVSPPDLDAGSDSNITNDNVTIDNTPTFTGTAEANATVELLDGSTVIGSATATGGNWTITPSLILGDGVHNIAARATDLAGNSTTPPSCR